MWVEGFHIAYDILGDMCVSDHMGLQNRVGRSGFILFGNIFLLFLE